MAVYTSTPSGQPVNDAHEAQRRTEPPPNRHPTIMQEAVGQAIDRGLDPKCQCMDVNSHLLRPCAVILREAVGSLFGVSNE